MASDEDLDDARITTRIIDGKRVQLPPRSGMSRQSRHEGRLLIDISVLRDRAQRRRACRQLFDESCHTRQIPIAVDVRISPSFRSAAGLPTDRSSRIADAWDVVPDLWPFR